MHYLRVCGKSSITERMCRTLLQEGTPYQYVRAELWHLLAEIGSDHTVRELTPLAKADLRNSPSAALSWGALRFLLEVQRRGGHSSASRVRYQPDLVQALLVEAIPDASYGPDGPVAMLLREGSQEAGACLAGN